MAEAKGYNVAQDRLREGKEFRLLGHEQIILFVFLYGGFIAQQYALRYQDHLVGLILSDTAPALDYPNVILSSNEGTERKRESCPTTISLSLVP